MVSLMLSNAVVSEKAQRRLALMIMVGAFGIVRPHADMGLIVEADYVEWVLELRVTIV